MSEETKINEEQLPKKEMGSKKDRHGLKTTGAVAGGVLLGNLAWGMAREAKDQIEDIIDENQDEVEATIEQGNSESIPEGGIEPAEVSSIVNDEMSFNDAFAAAREELGAGGVFVWNGNEYGTYYKEEWDNLSPEQTEEYWASVEAADVDVEQDLDSDLDDSVYEAVASEDEGENIEFMDDIEDDLEDYTPEVVTADLDGDGYEESMLADTNADGAIDVVVSDTNMDGQVDTMVTDTDFDGVPDVITVDTDGDGKPDVELPYAEDELISDNEIPDNNILTDDFDNDADMSDWA